MWLERGEHVCLVGANGSGKTTLLETLVGEREADGAKLRRGHNVKLGYLSQHPEIAGDPRRHPAVPRAARDRALGGEDAGAARPLPVQRRRRRQAPRRRLGRRGPAAGAGAADAVRRQRARPGRADQPPRPREPRGARGRAHRLRGIVLLVSHDRALLEAVGSRTLVIEGEALHSHPGGWAEYRSSVEAGAGGERRRRPRAEARPPRPGPRGRARTARRSWRGSSARSRRPRRTFKRLEDELADPSHWSDPRRSARATARHEAARAKLDELIARWEAAAERVEG